MRLAVIDLDKLFERAYVPQDWSGTQSYDMSVEWDDIEGAAAQPLTLNQFNAIHAMREDHVWPFDACPPYLFLESAIEKNDFCWISWAVAVDLLVDGYRAYSADNYGEKWRCWTRRPTDEERRAAAWQTT